MWPGKQKTDREDSWKTQGALCICHNLH